MINIIGNAIGAQKSGGAANLAFEFTVKTDNAGTSAADQFTIPITSATPYNISTSDGHNITGATGATTLTFSAPGTYTVKITESCIGWRFNNTGDRQKLLDISNWGVFAMTATGAFFGASNMTCSATDIPTGVHTRIESGFRNCSNFNGAIGNWDVSTVTGANRYIFNGASSFNQPLNSWNTSGFTDMTSMFAGASSFNQDLYNWDTSNVTSFSYMFYNATSFNGDIGAWDTGSCTRFDGMFRNTVFNNGGNPNINNWNTSNVTTLFEMFFQCSEFNQPIGNWDVSNVTDFRNALSCAFTTPGVFNQDLSSWTPTSATTFQNMFYNQQSFNSDLNSWVFPSCTSFNSMFGVCTSFNGNITSWNTSNITDMRAMFNAAYAFNQDISSWDVSSVTQFGSMFNNADAFNQPIGSWTLNTISPITMNSMFANTEVFNQDLGAWNTSQVTNMSQMFINAKAFNNGGSPNINNWNTSNVTDMSSMFYMGGRGQADQSFNQPIGNWNTSNVTNMSGMFYGNLVFDQPIGTWDTSNVTNMNVMFYITIIDQDLSNWNIGSITPNSANFNWLKRSNYGIPFSTANYDAMLVAYETQVPPVGLVWNIGDAKYTLGSAAEAARASLISTYGWTITDGGGIFVPFTMTVDTTLGDGLAQFTIPTTGTGYNYDVATSDGQSITGNTGNTTITFPATGTYTVEITGDFPTMYFNNAGDKLKLTNISKWGSVVWSTFNRSFNGCNNLTITATDAPNVSAVTDFFFAFHTCSSLSGSFDCSSWDLSSVSNIGYMFYGCQQLTDINLSSLNPAVSVYSDGVVASCTNLINVTFPVAFKPTSARYFAQSTPNLSTITNVEAFNTSAMTLCTFMFSASSFNQNIGTWDMSNVTDTQYMFQAATSFNQDISSWNVSNVLRADRMFSQASSFNQNLPNWTWTNLQFQGLDYIFERASSFNGDLSNWTFPNVTRLASVFDGVGGIMAFNNASIANWNVSNITLLSNTFRNCRNMNIDLSSWSTAPLTNMSQTFFEADVFDFSYITNWNIVDVSTFLNFMLGVPNLTTATYDAILVSWEAQLQAAYPGGTGYTLTPSISFNGSQYSLGTAAETARTSLINTFGWTITDGGGVLTNESYLVASYNFDSDFTDYTGNNPLTPSGITPPTAGVTGGKVSNCAEFNSSADWTLAADSDDFSFTDGVNDLPFSVSFWANFAGYDSTATGGAWFLSKRDASTNEEYQIYVYQNELAITLFSGGTGTNKINAKISYPPPLNVWHHYAFTYDGSATFAGIKMYIDGVSQTLTDTSTGTYTGMINGSQAINIGSRSWQTSNGSFFGKMDEYHIWKNREITAAEVTDIYNTENAGNSILPVPTSPPLLDTYTGAAAAYSLRDLSSSTTNVVRVRRSSDNTEQDFTSTQVTDGTLTTFVGAGNDGFVTVWYDQSGNGRNAAQTNTTLQPVIVSSGSLVLLNGLPAIDTEKTLGTNSKYLQTDTGSPFYAVNDASVVVVGAQKTGEQAWSRFIDLNYLDNFTMTRNSTTSGVASGFYTQSANVNQSITDNTQYQISLYRDASTGVNSLSINNLFPTTNTLSTTTAVANNLLIGQDNTYASTDTRKLIQEVVLWETNYLTTRSGINTSINSYYTIY